MLSKISLQKFVYLKKKSLQTLLYALRSNLKDLLDKLILFQFYVILGFNTLPFYLIYEQLCVTVGTHMLIMP